jgi:hypothetical protein
MEKKETVIKETNQENKEKQENPLEKAFNESYKRLLNGLDFSKSKNAYVSECLGYAVKLYISSGLKTPLLKVLTACKGIIAIKQYLNEHGLFYVQNVKTSYFKVIVDKESEFLNESYETFIDWINIQKKLKQENPTPVNYQKRLETLFKNKSKKEIQKIVESFVNGLKE